MGKAAKVTIVEAENIVPVGEIHPDNVHLPGIYVDRIVPADAPKLIEVRKTNEVKEEKGSDESKSEAQIRRERIARRTAKELKHGYYVNLGIGKYSITKVTIGVLLKIQVFQLWHHHTCRQRRKYGCNRKMEF